MVLVLQSKLLKSSCFTMYLSWWIHSVIPQQQNFSHLILFNNSLYIGSISTLSHDFGKKKIMFPIYFIQQLQWIILKLLHYDTSQSCSILVTRMKKKKPKTKAFKDTIQKVTNVSLKTKCFFFPRQCWLIIPKTKQQFADPIVNMNINKRKASHHLIFKADETVIASHWINSPQVTRCTWHQMTRICQMSSLFKFLISVQGAPAVTEGHFVLVKQEHEHVWQHHLIAVHIQVLLRNVNSDGKNWRAMRVTVPFEQHIYEQHRPSCCLFRKYKLFSNVNKPVEISTIFRSLMIWALDIFLTMGHCM